MSPFVSHAVTTCNNKFASQANYSVVPVDTLCHKEAMTKPKLTELAKARVDAQTKQELEQLMGVFGFREEADIVRAAFADFINKHRNLLPRRLPIAPR